MRDGLTNAESKTGSLQMGVRPPSQRAQEGGETLKHVWTQEAETFFRGKLTEVIEPTAPFGLLEIQLDDSQIDETSEVIEPALVQQVRNQARSAGVSTATLFHAAWALVMAQTSGHDDVVYGTVVRARTARAQRSLSMSHNALPLRLKLQNVTAKQLVEQTHIEFEELLPHEHSPLTQVQLCSGVPAPAPLFTALMKYRHNVFDGEAEQPSAAGIRVHERGVGRASYPVTLTLDDLGETVALTAQTDRRIDPHRIIGYLRTAVQSLVDALEHVPLTPVLALSILPDSERHQLIDLFNATQADYPRDKLAHELFEERVARSPDAVAVAYEGSQLSYAQLNEKSNQLAHYLRLRGVGPDQLVGICVGRSIEMVIGVLGILKAGGAYVPLDPSYPSERLTYLVQDAAPAVLLTLQGLRARLPQTAAVMIELDGDWQQIAQRPKVNLQAQELGLHPRHLAYVIYTSGSTGNPKGVMVEHGSVVNLWHGLEHLYRQSPACKHVALNASFNFDGSVKQLVQLLSGRMLTIVPQDYRLDAQSLLSFIEEQRIEGIDCTPSQLKLWVDAGLLESNYPHMVLIGGEPIEAEFWRRLGRCTGKRFFNVYGPTECTVDATACRVGQGQDEPNIGTSMENRRIYILDRQREPAPIGVAGEIYIGGEGVGRGYLNRPELTAERFVPDPFVSDARARMYKSGDLGRWRADGTIEYLGRNDHQVKVRGYRIELGEIEAQLAKHAQIREAVVLAREDVPGERRLVAYVVNHSNAASEAPESLRNEMVNEWATVHEETYQTNPLTGPSFIGWDSSYTGEPIPTSEMHEWVDCTIERIRSLEPKRILEIGCGVGLLLQHLAPQCEAYVAVDFSASAIEQLRQWTSRRADLNHVELSQHSATELQHLSAGSFDTVVLNSVVQYFPDIEYLLTVLQGAVRLLAPGGKIFLGDIRHLGLLPIFHHAVQMAKAAATVSVGQLKSCIARAMEQEKELVIDPQFFHELPRRLPGIRAAEVQLKRGRAPTEMTRHRYDVVLHTGEPTGASARCETLEWSAAIGSIEALEAALEERRWRAVRLSSIPNARLIREAAAQSLIETSDEQLEVGALRRQLNELPLIEVDPERLWELGQTHGYDVQVTWDAHGSPGSFAVRLLDRTRSVLLSPEEAQSLDAEKSWSSYANDPLGSGSKQQLIPELRDYLKERLPDYMIPSAWIVLKQLPLTPNGKLDRKALPAPERDAYAAKVYEAPQGENESTLAAIWQELLRVGRVGRLDNFFELGGHSLLIVRMKKRLLQVGLSLAVRNVYERPTLSALANTLAPDAGDKFDVPPNLIPTECDAITPHMLTLVELAPEEIRWIVESAPDGAANVQDIYPLTPLQEGVLFHHLLNDHGGDVYVLLSLLSFPSRQALEDFIGALQQVIDRHDALRTAVLWENLPRPLQVVYRQATLPVKEISLDADRDVTEQLKDWMKPERQRMDLRRAPLMRLQVAADPHGAQWHALLQRHHLVSDHDSYDTLRAEVVAHLNGRAQALPEPLPYRNHVAEALAYGRTHDAEAFFRSKLGDIDESTAPFALLDVHGDGSQLDRAQLTLEPTLAQRVRANARRMGVSAATLFHAAWALVVSRTSGRDDVVFGSVLLGRLQGSAGAQRILGLFMNTLPLRLRLQNAAAQELVEQTQRELAELLTYEQDSLAEAQRCSGISGSAPLFTTLLNYRHTFVDPKTELATVGVTLLSERDVTNYPITFSVDDFGEAFELLIETDRPLDAHRMVGYVITAMQSLVAALEQAPRTPALALSVLPDSERHQVLHSFNATQATYPQDKLIHELFEEQAARTPYQVAVVNADRHLTYRHLNNKANQLARYLRKQGVGPDCFVGLCVERTVDMVLGILGILKAGGAYVPLDTNYPQARLEYMLEDTKPKVVLTQEQLKQRLFPASPLVALDADWDEIAVEPVTDLGRAGASSHSLAYVIYTSGSTGQPKGVAIEHRNAVNLICWADAAMPSEVFERTLHSTSLNFDLSVFECFVPLATGGTVRVVENALALLNESTDVTLINTVPSAIQGILDSGSIPDTTRVVNLAGEALKKEVVDRIFACSTAEQVCNLYGPSETTTYSTWVSMSRQDGFAPTIGRPIANTQIYILDAHLRPTPMRVAGEIYIGGAGVARGYLNRPELTAERFLHDPFSADLQARMYKTGDLGRWRSDGSIEYLGRNDHQVKIRGYRIELGEVEAKLAAHPQVKDAAVIAREDVPGEKRMVAYVTRRDQSGLDLDALRAHLRAALPEYMTPGAFVALERLPLMANGKLDRRALPAPDLGSYMNGAYEAPQGEVEAILAGVWQSLLSMERVGRHDNFFELGGHSLLIVRMKERLRRAGLSLSVRNVYEHSTLSALANTLASDAGDKFDVPPNLIPARCDAITPQMLTLVELAPEHIKCIVESVTGGAANTQDIYPLTPLQEGVLFHHLLNEHGGDTYIVSMLLSLPSRQALEDFVGALQQVIHRHDALRTAVLWENLPRPLQVVYRQAVLPVEEISLDADRDAIEQIKEWMKPERLKMDVRRAPLMRLLVAADPHGAQWYAILEQHHLISDNGAAQTLFAEVAAHLKGGSQALPKPLPYRRHVAEALAHARTHDAEAFFRSKLGDIDEPTAPFELLDVHGDGSRIDQAHVAFEPKLARRVRANARRLGVSAATLFHAAWALVVSRTSGRDDVVFGSVLLGRLQGSAGGQRILGMFLNTLPLRLRLQDATAEELVGQTQRELVELLTHEQGQLAVAQRCSGISGSAPLFTALLNYRHHVADVKSELATVGVTPLATKGLTNYPIALSVDDSGEAFELTMETDRRLDPHRMAGYVITAMQSLLEALETAPLTPALALSVLGDSEWRRVVSLFNATEAGYPNEKLLHELIQEQVERTPSAIAVVYDKQALTYAELNSRANQLARYLRDHGVGPDRLVALFVERSVEMLVGLLAVLKAGGAYVPLDPTNPSDRLEHVLSDASPHAVLTLRALQDALPPTTAPVIAMDADWNEIAEQRMENLDPHSLRLGSQNLAYVIYTSGSTGKPKGVMVEHRNIVNYAEYALRQFAVVSGDGTLIVTSISFDLMLTGLYPTLLAGRTVRLCPEEQGLPLLAQELIKARNLAPLKLTPSHLALLEDALTSGQLADCVRVLVLGGEPLQAGAVQLWRKHAPGVRIFNHYGPTEATVGCVVNEIGEEVSGPAPIGRPIANTQIYILDSHLQPTPIGVAGEIYIGGAGVARGYLNRPELTAERFIEDPFSAAAGARLYRTGDLGRWREDGAIDCLGRNDHQVKVRGYRIELGEIEAQLAMHPQVREAVVLAREDVPGEKRLVAYVVADGNAAPVSQLRDYLSERLPGYMIPSAWTVLEQLPLTPNGKVDRHALPAPEGGREELGEYIAPRTESERMLADIWEQVLQIDRVGVQDNFFELGGHSLLVMRVATRIRSSLSIDMPMRLLFESPTISQLSAQVDERRQARLLDELARGDNDVRELLGEVSSMSEGKVEELVRELKMRMKP